MKRRPLTMAMLFCLLAGMLACTPDGAESEAGQQSQADKPAGENGLARVSSPVTAANCPVVHRELAYMGSSETPFQIVTYDRDGRVTEEWFAGEEAGSATTVAYSYDAEGRLVQTEYQYPDGGEMEVERVDYLPDGSVAEVYMVLGEEEERTEIRHFDDKGRLIRLEDHYGGQLNEEEVYAYDARDSLIRLEVYKGTGGDRVKIREWKVTRDSAGLKKEAVTAFLDKGTQSTESWSYTPSGHLAAHVQNLPVGSYEVSYSYTAQGALARRKSMRRTMDQVTLVCESFDECGRRTSMDDCTPSGEVLRRYSYEYY